MDRGRVAGGDHADDLSWSLPSLNGLVPYCYVLGTYSEVAGDAILDGAAVSS